MEEYQPVEIIYEAIQNRSPILKEAEEQIEILTNNYKNKEALNKLNNLLKKFTNINNFNISIKYNLYNAYCITIYTDFFNKTLLDYFKKEQKSKINIKQVQRNASQYIDRMYIVLGHKIMKECTPQETMAIILHEIGHAFNHTTNLPNILAWFNNKIRSVHKKILTLSLIPFGVGWLFMTLSFIIGNFSKTLSFFEHKQEYSADKFATQYGYGDDLSKVLIKFDSKFKKQKTLSWWKQLLVFLYKIIKPGESHPMTQDRLCQMLKTIQSDYIKKYQMN